MDRGNRQCILQQLPGLTSKIVHKYLPKSVAPVQGNLNQARKIQDIQKYQSQWIPETQKLSLSLEQWWIQGKYTQTKKVGFLSYPEG